MCIHIKSFESEFFIIVVCVDDLNPIRTAGELEKATSSLKENFEMKDLGKTKFCLPLQIEYIRIGIFIHHSIYLQNMIGKYLLLMTEAKIRPEQLLMN